MLCCPTRSSPASASAQCPSPSLHWCRCPIKIASSRWITRKSHILRQRSRFSKGPDLTICLVHSYTFFPAIKCNIRNGACVWRYTIRERDEDGAITKQQNLKLENFPSNSTRKKDDRKDMQQRNAIQPWERTSCHWQQRGQNLRALGWDKSDRDKYSMISLTCGIWKHQTQKRTKGNGSYQRLGERQ